MPQSPQHTNKGLSQLNLYQSINELPLKLFIDCLVDKNFYALVKSGEATIEQLQEAWQIIYKEYLDLMMGAEGKRLMQAQIDLTILDGRLRSINAMAKVISIMPDYITGEEPEMKELFDMMNKDCQSKFTFSKETRLDDVKRCLRRAASIKIQLDLKQIEYEALSKKAVASETPDRAYFSKNLITLSDHAKYKLDDSMTTFEYCERINRYSDYCKSLNR